MSGNLPPSKLVYPETGEARLAASFGEAIESLRVRLDALTFGGYVWRNITPE